MVFDPRIFPDITASKNLLKAASVLEREFHTNKRGLLNQVKRPRTLLLLF